MPAQTEESKQADINAFLDLYKEFSDAINARVGLDYMVHLHKIALFRIYVSIMER